MGVHRHGLSDETGEGERERARKKRCGEASYNDEMPTKLARVESSTGELGAQGGFEHEGFPIERRKAENAGASAAIKPHALRTCK